MWLFSLYLHRPTCQARNFFLVHVVGGGEVSKLGRQIRVEHPGIVGVDAERVSAETTEVAVGAGGGGSERKKNQKPGFAGHAQHTCTAVGIYTAVLLFSESRGITCLICGTRRIIGLPLIKDSSQPTLPLGKITLLLWTCSLNLHRKRITKHSPCVNPASHGRVFPVMRERQGQEV